MNTDDTVTLEYVDPFTGCLVTMKEYFGMSLNAYMAEMLAKARGLTQYTITKN